MVYFRGVRPYKRPEEASYLLSKVKKYFENITLFIVGEWPSKLALEYLVKDLGLEGGAIFTGKLKTDQLAKIISEAWLNYEGNTFCSWIYFWLIITF